MMGTCTIFITVFWDREKLSHMPKDSRAIRGCKWQEWKLVPDLAPPNP